MSGKITMGELKKIVYESESEKLNPLKRLFAFNDYMNDEYKKTHDGQENPFCNDEIVLGEKNERENN